MDDVERLPCGCIIGTVDDTFTIQACPLGNACQWVQFVIQETQAQAKPYTVLEA